MIDFAEAALTERRTPPQWPSDDEPSAKAQAFAALAKLLAENAVKIPPPMPFPWYLYEDIDAGKFTNGIDPDATVKMSGLGNFPGEITDIVLHEEALDNAAVQAIVEQKRRRA